MSEFQRPRFSAKDSHSTEVSAPGFAAGTKVTIFRAPLLNLPLIEGRAEVIERAGSYPDIYNVRFDGEGRVQRRLVHSGVWQNEPERMLANLIAHWQVTLAPELLATAPFLSRTDRVIAAERGRT